MLCRRDFVISIISPYSNHPSPEVLNPFTKA